MFLFYTATTLHSHFEFFKNPLKHTPVIIVDGFYESVSLKMILNQQPSLGFCKLVIKNFETALSRIVLIAI